MSAMVGVSPARNGLVFSSSSTIRNSVSAMPWAFAMSISRLNTLATRAVAGPSASWRAAADSQRWMRPAVAGSSGYQRPVVSYLRQR